MKFQKSIMLVVVFIIITTTAYSIFSTVLPASSNVGVSCEGVIFVANNTAYNLAHGDIYYSGQYPTVVYADNGCANAWESSKYTFTSSTVKLYTNTTNFSEPYPYVTNGTHYASYTYNKRMWIFGQDVSGSIGLLMAFLIGFAFIFITLKFLG